MNLAKTSVKIVLLFIMCLLAFCSCSEVNVGIAGIYPELVYDFQDGSEKPDVYLSVFSEISSGEGRISSIKVTNTETGMFWYTDKVDVLKDKSTKRIYAGYSTFCMPDGGSFEKGIYRAEYEDLAGKTFDISFTVNQDDADTYVSSVMRNNSRQILVINKDGSVAYAGPAEDYVSDNGKLIKKYPNARYYREYVYNPEYKAVYLLKPVYLQ